MRQIKASEVKPGMEVRWVDEGFSHQGTVDRVTADHGGYITRLTSGIFTTGLRSVTPVTVLAEPQPEEPTEFGAKVRVHDRRFVRLDEVEVRGGLVWFEEGTGYRWTWDDLCEMGPVTVIPDQGWTVPANTPEVPDRIEEWPEDDTALRPHKWMNEYGEIWRYGRNSHVEGWTCGYLLQNRPVYGPWDRVTGA